MHTKIGEMRTDIETMRSDMHQRFAGVESSIARLSEMLTLSLQQKHSADSGTSSMAVP